MNANFLVLMVIVAQNLLSKTTKTGKFPRPLDEAQEVEKNRVKFIFRSL
jgi:hypothetical protein